MGKKSSLMTPDPYHVPGYCGYVPQFKYRFGETFGNHTHSLLTDSFPSASQNSVLATLEPALYHKDCVTLPDEEKSWGNQKYVPHMVPGYTGYIPKKLNYFGSRYAETSLFAISDFKTDRKQRQEKMKSICNTPGNARIATPLKNRSAKPYPPLYTKQHPVSPFVMPIGHPQKYFMSGYTGFVPKARQYLGQGYPIITQRALHEDATESARLELAKRTPVKLNKRFDPLLPSSMLYTKGQGLMPHYTGHIPGERYKYGMTFGTSTRRAVSEVA